MLEMLRELSTYERDFFTKTLETMYEMRAEHREGGPTREPVSYTHLGHGVAGGACLQRVLLVGEHREIPSAAFFDGVGNRIQAVSYTHLRQQVGPQHIRIAQDTHAGGHKKTGHVGDEKIPSLPHAGLRECGETCEKLGKTAIIILILTVVPKNGLRGWLVRAF